MQFISLIYLLFAAAGVRARCGTDHPTSEQQAVAQHLHSRELERRAATSTNEGIDINIYYHVIASDNSLSGGYIDPSVLTRQTEALNERYKPHGITWTQAEAEWIINPEWSSNQDESAMKKEIRKGTYADLNVYIFPKLGFSKGKEIPEDMKLEGEMVFWPEKTRVGDFTWIMDSINLRWDVLIGNAPPHDLGMTLVHESGHWLGLYHTFQGGCEGDGDGIDDTPAEDSKVVLAHTGPFECAIGRNSCPGEGLDPVTNYMDYSADSCYREFTKGQEIRMYSQWAEFRAQHKRPTKWTNHWFNKKYWKKVENEVKDDI